jgi:hypothetical protein
MKPLIADKFSEFLKRFQNFEDAEFRSLEVIDATTIRATFALQDGARAFDWITVTLEFSSVSDAKLLSDSQLPLVDMSDGISLTQESQEIYFSLGNYRVSTTKESIFYIVSKSLKYQEGLF